MNGLLFSQDFLCDGIRETRAWKSQDAAAISELGTTWKSYFEPFSIGSTPNEAVTEDEIILKVLSSLGWAASYLRQQTATQNRREDVPDMLLFADVAHKQKALREKKDDKRYPHGIAILESKRWLRALDRGDATDPLDRSTPSNQILRYLSSAEIASNRQIRFGILTNGRYWRLYYQGARSRSEEFFEIDLAAAVGLPGFTDDLFALPQEDALKIFVCLFRREAFLPQTEDPQGRTFHDIALAEARRYEEKISQDLGERVFNQLFPDLADALAKNDPSAKRPYTRAYLDDVRDTALILLYRLLFLLYAEDRHLLPVNDARYLGYSLRTLRESIRDKRDNSQVFSTQAARIWADVTGLFRAVAHGDAAMGLPAYNGGLFDDTRTPLLVRVHLPDSVLAPLIDELSRRSDDLLRAWINYRDLSVQHLGSIYERLLEYRLEEHGGRLIAEPTSFARRTSGSYYTHDALVKLIVGETLKALIAERRDGFDRQLAQWKKRAELKPTEWETLDNIDPASRLLDLKICDPAMGSGHFLVSLVDTMSDTILEAMSYAQEIVAEQPWHSAVANPWSSPLSGRLADVRERILRAARKNGWAIDAAQLDDRHLVRRMILKRVIHGVDKNPMAVELAKVSLWLHTFTVGAPLSFLDHHLRCGDALFGESVFTLQQELAQLKGNLLQQNELRSVDSARTTMYAISELTDIDIAEAHHSKALMDTIETELAKLRRAFDFVQARRWAGRSDAEAFQRTWVGLLNQEFGDNLLSALDLLTQPGLKLFNDRQRETYSVVQQAAARAALEHFLHWELAFPTVWPGNGAPGGFDAVIGNPPWDRMKLQEVEWFSERRPAIAHATRASDRKDLIKKLKEDGDPLWGEYENAKERAETATRVARASDDYPLLSGGDVNLYSLFVERATRLIKPRGVVGLLTPSGIAADKGAAEFFRGISSGGHLAALYDFENKKAFFPDVDSRFKFCALVFGGPQRTFDSARCAFYLHDVKELDAPDRALTLTAQDFDAVNPNTGAAPIFRTQRDADITTAIYRRQPVFVDRRPEAQGLPAKKVWPVRYVRMFDMTNDSNLFMTRAELEQQGWYPVAGNRWKKGEEAAVPLYVGRMIHQYDHRSAHVTVNDENLHNAALSNTLSETEKADPNRFPTPQYWVSSDSVPEPLRFPWAIGFRDIARSTDIRTMISSCIPGTACGNKVPMLLPNEKDGNGYHQFAPLLIANLNSICFDFVTRQKIQSTSLNWYIVEQLPLIIPEQFEAKIGKTKIADFVRDEVLRLSYTAWDLQPFAKDLGYDGPPFVWDEDDRRHRKARLDALFFRLYGLGKEDAAYILDTFPIVREKDKALFGRYLTKDLILAYMNALAAGDTETAITL